MLFFNVIYELKTVLLCKTLWRKQQQQEYEILHFPRDCMW